MDKKQLQKICTDLGADLFGIADISSIKDEFLLDKNTLKELNRAICLGMRVSSMVLSEIKGHPNRLYYYHYKTLNMFLDQMALRVSNMIQDAGYLALAIPTSQIVEWGKQTSHLSHKKVAELAGLGWIGRSNLLVNEKLGSQFRLVTILTNLDLPADKPLKKDCGTCVACIEVCPAQAIKKDSKDFNHEACFEKLKEFYRKKYTEQYICGVCVKACVGRKTNIR